MRLDTLTSLRFVAAALVLVYHGVPILIPDRWAQYPVAAGFVGVGFFFALSGFVLMWT